jgi:hypothetical protein
MHNQDGNDRFIYYEIKGFLHSLSAMNFEDFSEISNAFLLSAYSFTSLQNISLHLW